MQSPIKTVKELLEDNWSLADDEDQILFYMGVHDPEARFKQKRIVFEFFGMTAPHDKKSLTRAKVERSIMVDIWIKMDRAMTFETGDELRQAFLDEIDSIIKTNQTSATDLDYVYVGSSTDLDQQEEDVLRTQVRVICTYQV